MTVCKNSKTRNKKAVRTVFKVYDEDQKRDIRILYEGPDPVDDESVSTVIADNKVMYPGVPTSGMTISDHTKKR